MINYLEWLKNKNFSPSTLYLYEKIISKYYGKLPLTTENILAFIKKLSQKREPATCQLYRAALVSYAKFSQVKIDWESINRLIPVKVKKFYTTINEKELQSLKQVRFEKSACKHQRNNLLLDFLFYSGLRVSELVQIKHSDWQENSLRIKGKGNKVRHVFLPDFLIKHFNFGSSDYLFTNLQGKPILADRVRKIVQKRLKLTGLNKWVSPHTFRRSLATNLYNRGGKLETIQKQLGHSNIQTTLGYIHNDFNTLHADYSKLFRSLGQNQVLRNYSTAELLAEINRRVGGEYA